MFFHFFSSSKKITFSAVPHDGILCNPIINFTEKKSRLQHFFYLFFFTITVIFHTDKSEEFPDVMAIKKDKKNSAVKTGFFARKIKLFFKTLYAISLIALGGLLFNLDRMGDFGITLLKYKNFLPHPIPRFLPGGSASEATALRHQTLNGQIIEVYDGDTATLLNKDCKYKIRFYGMDAPEAAQEFGIDSRNALREKILGKNVTVKVAATDRYSRAVGKVFINSRYINQEMISEGNAWYYSDYAPNEYDLETAEKSARHAQIGIWQKNSPQPPWEYRRLNQKK